ncbi:MAG: CHASE2 domain-containing protein, partial [Gammaproteobacteria bacterium]|nr:CHASE2 domain-containing protein [Gammaproteobacteria bacterium]
MLPSYQRFEYLLNDSQQWLVSSEQYYDDVLMIDIDDRSLIELQPYFGTWPYTRDTYALLLDYLTEMGAKTIVLDILLTDPRKKDDLLAEAIDRNKNTVLITSAPADYAVLNSQEAERLSHFAWRVPIMLPMTHWKSVLTPAPELIKNTSSTMELGMASVLEDIDGTLRRIPLMHDVAGLALPSLPLATLASDELPHSLKYDSTRGIASYGENEWPIDTEGKIHLSFPKNPNSVLTMSFLQVAKAALGLIKLENSKSFFHDMTVFIGSTAYHADRVTTPRGVMSGTIVVAIAYQNLKKNT